MTRTSAVIGFALLLVTTAASGAGPDRTACIAAADDGQKLRDDGKLTSAREKFITCASKSCPGAVAKQCNQWLQDAERDIPSVTFRARDERGKETTSVRVLLDDRPVSDSIDGRALPLDPGEHKVRFERADGTSVEDKFVLRPAEKNRLVELSFEPPAPLQPEPEPVQAPPAPPLPEDRSFTIPVLGWVGAGVGVAGIGMTALFAIGANNDESHLRSTCAPSCPSSEKDAIDSKIVLANVGMGIGIVGLGVAVVSTVLANTGKRSTTGQPSIVVGPSHGGARLGVVGTF